MRRLAVFDIDGTLTDTNAVDNECFVRAVAEVFGLDADQLDWSRAPHITDMALLHWLCEEHCGRCPGEAEVAAVIDRFLALLGDQLRAAPHRFNMIPGAAAVFDSLRAAGWEIALATGACEPSARLKLRAAGFAVDGCVLASSTDAAARTAIMELAVQRAAQSTAGAFDRMVNIGDGVWDVRAAAELGWPFVGIASGERADRLRAAGAAVVLPDLLDLAALHGALDSAPIPRATAAAGVAAAT